MRAGHGFQTRHTRAKGWLTSLVFPLSLLVVPITGVATTVAHYSARIWQIEDGLPRNCVQAVVQTRDGYLWAGTQNGLVRFDGVHFTVFDRSNVPQMHNANVLALHESRDGSLWIATGWGGVLQLKEGRFVHYGQSDGLAHDEALAAIYETRDGALWFATFKGLSRLKDGKFTTLGPSTGLSSEVVHGMCEDPTGNLWLATSEGVDCWKEGVVTRRLGRAEGLKTVDARAICCDCEGTVWIGAGDALTCLRKDGQMETFSPTNHASYDVITRLFADRHGTLWVGSEGGISRFAEGKFVPEVTPDGLRYDLVNAVYEDREENIWVGSRDGLIRFRRKRFEVYGSQQGLSYNNVTSVLEDHAGTLWIGTWGGGLNRLSQGTIAPLPRSGVSPVFVLGLLEAASGEIWAGVDYDGGVYRFVSETPTHYTPRQGLPKNAIHVLCQDRASNVWVGATTGLYRFQGKRFKTFGKDHDLSTAVVRVLHEDRAGNLWVGTESGLWRIHGQTLDKVTEVQGLAQKRIIAICEDKEGTLWLGSAGGGLIRFKDDRFVTINSQQGLFSDSVCEILEDDRGWFWMTSLRGIFRVRRADLEALVAGRRSTIHCLAYSKADGLWTEVCSSVAKPGAWKSKDGRLWFATLKGLCTIDPNEQVDGYRPPPPVVLERVLADKKPYPAQETLPVPALIRIPPGRGELEFRYSALSFQVPERNRFKYRLEGFDREWVDAGTRRVAFYNSLAPGKYRFQVLARNSDGIWNEAGTAAELVLLPHFWQTWWFRLAVAGGLGLAIFGLLRMRLARYRELEALRLRIATDLHDEVGSNLSTLSLLSRKLLKDGAVAQEKHEDLLALNRIAGQTSNAIREIVWLINPEYDTLQDLALRMEVTAKTVLSALDCRFQCHLREGTLRLPPQHRQSLYLLFKETVTNVARHAQASRVEITIDQRDHTWEMVVQDDGLGFDPAVSHLGNGLKNLRRRADRLNGHLELQSRPGTGTTVRFALKLP
jgi:ligand-binding sensor domain-containing protein/signal transduction histidine kinase